MRKEKSYGASQPELFCDDVAGTHWWLSGCTRAVLTANTLAVAYNGKHAELFNPCLVAGCGGMTLDLCEAMRRTLLRFLTSASDSGLLIYEGGIDSDGNG